MQSGSDFFRERGCRTKKKPALLIFFPFFLFLDFFSGPPTSVISKIASEMVIDSIAPAQTSMSSAELGTYISAQAYTQAPIMPKKLALAIFIIVLILLTIATLVTGLRIYARAWMSRRSKVWGWEDVFAVLAYVKCFRFIFIFYRHLFFSQKLMHRPLAVDIPDPLLLQQHLFDQGDPLRAGHSRRRINGIH